MSAVVVAGDAADVGVVGAELRGIRLAALLCI